MTPPNQPDRRHFLRLLGAGGLACAFRLDAGPGRSGPLRGIFPIAQTPFTAADKLDVDALVRQVEFLDRCGVHGIVWPQLASEYETLAESERLAGAEALLRAGKKVKPAIVIGVQAPDPATAVRYARHAEKHGADAIISLPPAGEKDPEAILAYYKEVGKAAALPLFAQTIGDMSVDFVVRMAREIPTFRYVKDEAGPTLPRISEFRSKAPQLLIHTGAHGRTLIDEMFRGSAGSMPAASFADLYVLVWESWQAGRRKEAMERYGRTLLLITEVEQYGIESFKYILHVRGVFPAYATRRRTSRPLDDDGKRALREILDYLKPHLRA